MISSIFAKMRNFANFCLFWRHFAKIFKHSHFRENFWENRKHNCLPITTSPRLPASTSGKHTVTYTDKLRGNLKWTFRYFIKNLGVENLPTFSQHSAWTITFMATTIEFCTAHWDKANNLTIQILRTFVRVNNALLLVWNKVNLCCRVICRKVMN
jgi:hypothetical protein